MVLTFGLIVVFRLEFSLNMVAAILTVIGYSMNDTVVVFDRLRENLRKYIQRFSRVQYNIPDAHPAAVISAFH